MVNELGRKQTIEIMNEYADHGQSFLFIISFDMEHNFVMNPGEATDAGIRYRTPFHASKDPDYRVPEELIFRKFPVSKDRYRKAFEFLQERIRMGDSYLINLTFPSLLETNLDLETIYAKSEAPYKLLMPGQFVLFSPEAFIRIEKDQIYSHPMKGTIDASIPDAERLLLNDRKERAEHHTIVDLIRNDLSMIAHDVRMKRFKYLDLIRTREKDLYQMSSEITGRLEPGYRQKMGELVFRMLPAGSVTGAPKKRTLELIREAEGYDRGYYTGIFGYFDGRDLDSAVMIRFIEKQGEQLIYKSGGGITYMSEWEKEYNELCDKVYVPFY
ncbi:MAG: aminodeoxychorismate synthase component I [Bacteroidota bacterium]